MGGSKAKGRESLSMCGYSWTSGTGSHTSHRCDITNVGGSRHPGSHVCSTPGCGETA